MLIRLFMSIFDVEYNFATLLVKKGLEITKLTISSELKNVLIDRVHRLRIDARCALYLICFAVIVIGIPLEFQIWGLKFQIWDLEYQLWLLKFATGILRFLSYFQGFLEGTAFGLLLAASRRYISGWFNLQQQKVQVYYLYYRCTVI